MMNQKRALTLCLGVFALVFSLSNCGLKQNKGMIKKGATTENKAPDFSLSDDSGAVWTLSEHLGTKISLAFYPKNNSTYCTLQAKNLSTNKDLLKEHGILPIMINNEKSESDRKFKNDNDLDVTILSDPGRKIAKLYASTYPLLVTKRVTILIDEQGMIVGRIEDVTVRDHAQQIIDGFESVKA